MSFFISEVSHSGPVEGAMPVKVSTGLLVTPDGIRYNSAMSVPGRQAGQEAPLLGAQFHIYTPAELGHISGSHGSLRAAMTSCWLEPRVSSESQHSTL